MFPFLLYFRFTIIYNGTFAYSMLLLNGVLGHRNTRERGGKLLLKTIGSDTNTWEKKFVKAIQHLLKVTGYA